ncbi:MAG TPA: conjugal transfer protein TrbL family protein [Candidatus Binatia bacterium]|nr:conjugal transfer protein TrbL family protein [Candidatus Binatia bacterium]
MALLILGAAPTGLAGLITQLLDQLAKSGSQDVQSLLDGYLLSTTDPSHLGAPLTGNATLAGLNHGFCLAGDTLLVLVVIGLAVRGFSGRSIASQHDLRAALPRVLMAVVLIHLSLTLLQMTVDLNNALCNFTTGLGGGGLPWTGPLSSSALQSSSLAGDLFEVIVLLALVVAVALLGFAYVIRMAVLQVLIAVAPLAALASILPVTRGFARAWSRIWVVAVFMQAGQLAVLSVATATGLSAGSGLAAEIYALATLWVALKVPGFLAAATEPNGSVAALTRGAVLSARRIHLPAMDREL